MICKKEDIESYLFSKLLLRWNDSGRKNFNYCEALGCCVSTLNLPEVNTSGMTYAEVNSMIYKACNLMLDYVELRRELSK